MIPVTTFAGCKLALFGLGSSGLATCRALVAGGADVIAFDDDQKKVAEAAAAGIGTADLGRIDWPGLSALVLTPGVPLTHPAPHWSVGLSRAAHRSFSVERPASASITEMIQNRITICGSVQPFCSKW